MLCLSASISDGSRWMETLHRYPIWTRTEELLLHHSETIIYLLEQPLKGSCICNHFAFIQDCTTLLQLAKLQFCHHHYHITPHMAIIWSSITDVLWHFALGLLAHYAAQPLLFKKKKKPNSMYFLFACICLNMDMSSKLCVNQAYWTALAALEIFPL